MNRTDLIIDFETFGVETTKCAVADLSTITFDWDRFTVEPYTYDELLSMAVRYKFSASDQLKNYGYKCEKSTMDFWASQPKEVRARVAPKDDDLTIKEFVESFLSDISSGPKIEYWWSRNNSFDPPLLARLFHAEKKWHSLDQYLPHWRVRDVKTWIDAKFDFSTRSGFVPLADEAYWNATFKQHDSSHDVVADVLRLQAIKRAESDLEQTKR